MWHKPCRTFHPWCLCIKTRCLSTLWAKLYQHATHSSLRHDDVIKWKHFRRYWPFLRGIHRSPVNSPHKGQWRGVCCFFDLCLEKNGWWCTDLANTNRSHLGHYRWREDVVFLMKFSSLFFYWKLSKWRSWRDGVIALCRCSRYASRVVFYYCGILRKHDVSTLQQLLQVLHGRLC